MECQYWPTLTTQIKDDYTTNSHYISCTFLFTRSGECVLFELRSQRVKKNNNLEQNGAFPFPQVESSQCLQHKAWNASTDPLWPLRSKMIILPILTTSVVHFSLQGRENVYFLSLGVKGLKRTTIWSKMGHFLSHKWSRVNVYSIKHGMPVLTHSDHSDQRWLYYQFSLHQLYISLYKVGRMCTFWA